LDEPMTEPLTCSVSLVDDMALVSAVGQLDLRSAPTLRAALRKADAEQPRAVIIDARRLESVSALAVLALLPPAQPHERWYAPRLLCAASVQLRHVLREGAQTGKLPVYPTREAALAAAQDIVAQRLVRDIAATPAAPGHAREFLAEACAQWQLTDLMPAGQLIISELCANVVIHVGSPMTVVLLRTATSLHIVVRDQASAPPVLGPPMAESTALNGRGLRLVDHLATGWGYVPTSSGKAVWALLRRHRQAATSD
jgi:anti-sigma regulatory factor (Ser/Thr protein kinase)